MLVVNTYLHNYVCILHLEKLKELRILHLHRITARYIRFFLYLVTLPV